MVPIEFKSGSTNVLYYSAEKESSLSRWCIASLNMYHFLSVIDFSYEKYIVSTGHSYSWYQKRRYSGDADGEIQACNPLTINRVL